KTNTVTVTFNGSANSPDLRIAEYTGTNVTSPIDTTASALGTDSTSAVSLTTTSANDMIVAANLVQTITTGPGSGFTSRVITKPDGDILEDELASTAATYNATAPIAPPGAWIMQSLALRAANSAPLALT